MTNREYTLVELAKLVAVDPNAVKRWTQHQLLPRPVLRRRSQASPINIYSERHLALAQRIKELIGRGGKNHDHASVKRILDAERATTTPPAELHDAASAWRERAHHGRDQRP